MRKRAHYFLYVGLALLLGVVLNRGSGTRVSYAAPAAQTVVNVALGKPASQSSTFTADYPASRAVDGNTDGNYLSKSINHTNYDVNAWWQVDLGSATAINTITLWNRTDCCSDRLTNFFVFVANYDMTGKGFGDLVVDNTVWRYSLGTTAPTTLNIPVNTTGRYVRVQLASTNNLHLAEVQVFGPATSGTGTGATVTTDFENGTLGMFTSSSGAGITTSAYNGQKAAIAANTGNTVAARGNLSPGVQVSVSAWVKGIGTVYVSFARSNFSEIANVSRSLNSATWQQVTFTGVAPADTVFYDLIFRADNGAFLVDDVTWTVGTSAVPNGIYLVKAVHSGKCMEVAGAGTVNGSNVQQWSCNPTASHHQWQFTAVGNGYYRITNVNSGKVLDVAGISTADGANLHQWDNLDGNNQKWKPVAQSDGSYQLVALHSNKCADVWGAAADGVNLAQHACHTGTNQRFTLTPVTAAPPATTNLPEGTYLVKAVHSGKCLEVNGASKSDAAMIQQWGCNATVANQQWRFVAVGNDYYKIINANSGKVLDVSSVSTLNWAMIWQWSDLNRNNQQWKPVRQGDGSYQLVAAHSNKCADMSGSAIATYDGALLYQYDCNTGANQRFTLTPVTAAPPATTNLPEGIYLVRAVHSGKCMQVIGARLVIGVNTEQWSCDAAAKHQQWRFVAVGNGYYKIININSGKVLDVWGVSTADTMPLWQMDDLNRDNQKWKPVLQSDGSYQLVALHSNKCGTVTNAATADGAGIAQHPCSTGAHQRFRLDLLAEMIVTNFEDNSLGMFTGGNGSSLTNDAESGQKAAIAPATGNSVTTRNAISPQTPITVIAWVKGVGTAYVSFARSNFSEISNTYRTVNSPTWQQITFAATAPIGTVAYDLVFRADNGAFLVDNIVVILNERDTDNDSLSDRVESCSNLGSLNYEFYDVSVAGYNLNNLPTTGARAKGVTADFDVQRLQNQFTPTDPHHYGLRYSGYLWIREAGQYTFFTNSDDGSLLSLDNRLVVNNDGSHPLTERSGTVYLYAGLHRFQLLYSAYTTPNSLAVQWSGPSFSKTALPFNRLLSCDPNTDTDQDGIPNVRDLDSDDDTIPDAVENSG